MSETGKMESGVAVVREGDAHHPYGPSRWPALLECPRWEGKGGTADAERGTQLHKAFERVLNGEEVETADEMEGRVERLAQYLLALAGNSEVHTELRVEVPIPAGCVATAVHGVFGRVDAEWLDVCGDHGVLHVVDLKTAYNPERDYLPQLLAYAAGLLRKTINVKEVELHVVYADTGRDKTTRLSVDEAMERFKECYKAIDRIAYAEKHPESGRMEALSAVQCGWCGICAKQAACPACVAVAEKVNEKLAGVTSPERWNTLQPTGKAQLCVLAEAVIKWGEAVKALAGEDCKAGIPIEDPEHGIFYGLQERKGTLRLETDAVWELCKAKGVGRDEFVGSLKVDATKAAALLKAHGMKAVEAKEALEGCGERGPSSVSFVRKSVK